MYNSKLYRIFNLNNFFFFLFPILHVYINVWFPILYFQYIFYFSDLHQTSVLKISSYISREEKLTNYYYLQ